MLVLQVIAFGVHVNAGNFAQAYPVGLISSHLSSLSAIRNKCHATRNRCLTSSNKKLVEQRGARFGQTGLTA